MHYFSFNIGDYLSHTRHLSPMEDIAYRRLLDLYYLHEQPINECSTTVARLINLREYHVEVNNILLEFFELIEGVGWINQRADIEIEKYKNKQITAVKAGKASAAKRSNARSTNVQPNKKQETINNKQETITKVKEISIPDGVSRETWNDFLKTRKGKSAAMSESAIKGIAREAKKAGWPLEKALIECCARGWVGFKAEWVNKDQGNKTQHQINQEGIARSIGLLPKHDQFQSNVNEGEIYDADPNTTKQLG